MAADNREIREILENSIGDVYKTALEKLGSADAAKEVTRRVMALLKRTHDAGLSVTPDTVRRITEDCCREQLSYDSRKASFKNGVIADMPDFDTAISGITSKDISAAEKKAEAKAAPSGHAAEGDSYEEQEKKHAPKKLRAEKKAAEDLDDDDDDDDDDEEEHRHGLFRRKNKKEDYDDDEDDDDEDEDEEEESLFADKPSQPLLPIIGIWVLILLLAAVTFCLVVMLMQRNVLPGGSAKWVQNFITWFNGSFFQLF